MKSVSLIESEIVKKKVPQFGPGDELKVYLQVKEGDKTRTQVFEGTCIFRRGGGARASFGVVKETYGDMVEKIFPLFSPIVQKIVVTRKGKVRRAKLYYLTKR